MISCFFVTDLHGKIERYTKLFQKIDEEKPDVVFFGGDLLPSGLFSLTKYKHNVTDFLKDFLIPQLTNLRKKLGHKYLEIFLILGNDDGRIIEQEIINAGSTGLWQYIHHRKVEFRSFSVYGYSYVPPTPFLLKDWERYDVSRYHDPGCVSPEKGFHSIDIPKNQIRYASIQKDIEELTENADLSNSIFLFHSPPYQTKLDRAALDGKMIDHVPLDVHVGSIAIKRFIETKQPFVTLHGHIHESARLTGSWKEQIGKTQLFSAAHDGPELALVSFDLENPKNNKRRLI